MNKVFFFKSEYFLHLLQKIESTGDQATPTESTRLTGFGLQEKYENTYGRYLSTALNVTVHLAMPFKPGSLLSSLARLRKLRRLSLPGSVVARRSRNDMSAA